MNNRLALKEKLLYTLEQIKSQRLGKTDAPLTNVKLEEKLAREIEGLTTALEALNPNLYPILYALPLLNGAWQLEYSTAREIRSLAKLPYGLQVGKVYQVIDLATNLFLTKLLSLTVSGYSQDMYELRRLLKWLNPIHLFYRTDELMSFFKSGF